MGKTDELQIVVRARDAATAEFRKISGSIRQLAQTVREHWAAAAAAIYAAIRTVSGAWKMLDMAANIQEQREALDKLTARFGTSAGEIVKAVKEASQGLLPLKPILDSIGDSIMRNMDPRLLKEFAAGAVVMAKVTGQSVAEAYQEIIEAVTLGSPRAMKRIVGVIDLREVFGESAAAMSESQQVMARQKLVLEALIMRQKEYGKVVDSTDDKITRFKITMGDLRFTMGEILEKMFAGPIATAGSALSSVYASLKEIHTSNKPLFEAFGGIFNSMLTSLGGILKTTWEIAKASGALLIGFTALTAILKVANLLVAGLADFINLFKLGLFTLQFIFDEALVRPMQELLLWGARLAEILGKKEFAKGLRDSVAESQDRMAGVRLEMVRIAEAFAEGKTYTAEAIKANERLLAVMEGQTREKKKQAKTPAGSPPPPKSSPLSVDQKAALRDFMKWYREQSLSISAEISAMHGNEAAALQAAYEKSLEGVKQQIVNLGKMGLLKPGKEEGSYLEEIFPELPKEAQEKVRAALARINEIRAQMKQLHLDKTVQLQLATDERIAELTLVSDEQIHQAKLARIKDQYRDNAALRDAYLEEENRRHVQAFRDRAATIRKLQEETAGFYMAGRAKEAAGLRAAYAADVDSHREMVAQKEITWAQYDEWVKGREWQLQEDLKRLYGTQLDGMRESWRDYFDKLGNEYERGKSMMDQALGGMENSLASMFDNMRSRGDFFKQFWRDLTQEMSRIWSRTIAQMTMQLIGSGLASLFGGGSSLAGAQGSFGPAAPGGGGTAYAAMGGIFQGGFQPAFALPGGGSMPFRAFSSGGIVRRPTVGLVGEGGQNEAVVPLPDGKAIPVKMSGRGPASINITNEWTIVAMDSTNMDQAIMERRDMIEGMMYSSLVRGGVIRDAVKRYGR